MSWQALQSNHLGGFDYDSESRLLTIQFTNGAVYNYAGVPAHVADVLSQSNSPGTYFHDKIRGAYREVKIAAGRTKSGRESARGTGTRGVRSR